MGCVDTRRNDMIRGVLGMQDAARRRSDAGVLQITDRDILALTWIGEQYAITFDQLRRLLGQHSTAAVKDTLSVSATRNALQRWQQLGLIEQPRKLRAGHPSYIWLSRKGLSQIGLPYPYYEPKLSNLAHINDVNTIRLHIQAQHIWIPRRTLRAAAARMQDADQDNSPLPDAEFYQASRIATAIVIVERPKPLTELASNVHGMLEHYETVWYYLHAENIESMREILTTLEQPECVTAYTLDMERISGTQNDPPDTRPLQRNPTLVAHRSRRSTPGAPG